VVSVSEFDLLAASLRADSKDVGSFVEALAVKLSESFPQRARVERKGGLFGGRQRVRRVTVVLGENEYVLDSESGQVSCCSRKVVRGIALKTEELPLEKWIDALAKGLVEESSQSESDRAALARLLSD
jgi:hypothetical protein